MTEPGNRKSAWLRPLLSAPADTIRKFLWPLVWPVVAVTLPSLLGGCALNHNQSYMVPEGPVAAREYSIFMVTVYVTVAIFIVVTGALLFAVFKFRDQGTDPELPPQTHGNALIEGTLGIVSALLLVLIAVPTVNGIWYTTDAPEEAGSAPTPSASGSPAPMAQVLADKAPLTVIVTGHQWWWEFEYPELGLKTADELHIPAGRPIAIKELSADVIHSFWVPRLAGKVDVIPGQENHMWLQADHPGYYFGQCAEFCGASHALMGFRVISDSPDDFAAWVKHQKEDAAPATDSTKPGQDIVEGVCNACHTVRGTNAGGVIGPDLTHLASRGRIVAEWLERNDHNLHEWLNNPQAVKPEAKMILPRQLTDTEIDDVTRYLDTLK